jgi:hypothetical protein
MRVAYFSPLPPAKTGIAHYSAVLLPALRQHVDVVLEGRDCDVAIYQLGNNPHHEAIYRAALGHPGIAVLHDVVLHHLIVEMTLARGDAAGYVAALEANHGAAGAAWARGRAAGLHSEMGNFLFPASIEVARRSRAVIVHNRWAGELLRAHGVTTPIHVVPHPATPRPPAPRPPRPVAGVFGFLTAAKRADVILEAAGRAGIELLVVGEAAPDIDTTRIRTTGYVADEEFDGYYGRVDRIINLRYPSAGETSGTLMKAFEHGKPVAVSDYAQFAEFPDDCVTKIPLGEGEVEALTRFLTGVPDYEAIARAQRDWIERHARIERTVAGYLTALRGGAADLPEGRSSAERSPIAFFPKLEVVARERTHLTLRNAGDATIRTRVYGAPGYRLLAKLFEGNAEVADRWIELPRDLAPGETAIVTIPFREGTTLRLLHALEGVPMIDAEPWYAAAL